MTTNKRESSQYSTSNKRRRQKESAGGRRHAKSRNPRRGGPGFLLTCDVGREVKCAREGKDIISHYYHHSFIDMSNSCDDINDLEQHELKGQSHLKPAERSKNPLSLEEEISMLREGASADQVLLKSDETKQPPFELYETGCRGVVVLLLHNNKTAIDDDETDESMYVDNSALSLAPVFTSKDEDRMTIPLKAFNPISLVKRVMQDITEGEQDAPRSRFVTRMIPIQTTCFANMNEISTAAKQLIDSRFRHKLHQVNDSLPKSKISFEILFKKRICSNVTREDCINVVASHFDEGRFKVDLTNPEYTFVMEVCKTLVCMSIVHNFKSSCHNFNLFQISEKAKENRRGKDDVRE